MIVLHLLGLVIFGVRCQIEESLDLASGSHDLIENEVVERIVPVREWAR